MMHEIFQKIVNAVGYGCGNGNNASNTSSRCHCGPQCSHCKCHHHNIPDDKCWELEANAVSHLANWILVKNQPIHSI